MPKSDSDILFSISSAHVTLETKLLLKVGGRCAVTFKTVSGTLFHEMEQDLRRFLASLHPEFDLSFRAVTDRYGYLWIVLEGSRIEDLLAGLTAAGDIVEERGFSDQLLAAVFEFRSDLDASPQYLVYNFKRNNFYPFVPATGKSRDTEKEMKIMSAISEEVPFERDMSLWYPLWDLPLRSPG
jgi:PspAB-like protein